MFIKAIILESVQRDGGLQYILEINKTKQILSSALRGLLYQSDALVPWEGSEHV